LTSAARGGAGAGVGEGARARARAGQVNFTATVKEEARLHSSRAPLIFLAPSPPPPPLLLIIAPILPDTVIKHGAGWNKIAVVSLMTGDTSL